MSDWYDALLYLALAMLCAGLYGAIGYLGRKTYNRVSEGRDR